MPQRFFSLPALVMTICSLALVSCEDESATPLEVGIEQTAPTPTPTVAEPVDPAAARAAYFDTFTIKGAGGEHYIESAAAHGANVIRTWSVKNDGSSKALLDQAHSLGLKVIMGIWMPQPKDAKEHRVKVDWKEDYASNRDKYLSRMKTLLDLYDDHPALLAWGLGNEVELSPEYLKTVQLMSKAVHAHNPRRHTCTVIVNAPKEAILAIKQYAPDLDLIGANSYGNGSMFTVANSLEKHWGKRYFFAEYAHHGPWSVKKTDSNYPLEFSPAAKVNRLNKAFAVLDNRPLCAGSVYFLWGPFQNGTHTWFSGLLPKDPTTSAKDAPAYLTPYTDALKTYWSGQPAGNLAPVISHGTLNEKYGPTLTVAPDSPLQVKIQAEDAEGDELTYQHWLFQTRKHERRAAIAGPFSGGPEMTVTAPGEPDTYVLLTYVTDGNGKASSHQIPFRVQ